MNLDFIQIIYNDIQAEHCYPFARIHKNETLTPYFENSVIRELIPNCNSGIIGIVSWRLKQKRGDMFRLIDKSLTLEKLTETEYDVAVLTPRSPTHQALHMAANWHSPNWTPAFEVFKRFLRTDLGIKVPTELSHPIYENHFVAKREIYHEYVSSCLVPSIEFMHSNSDIFLCDAGYAKRKTSAERQRYFGLTGRKDWPIAPFILERLFSIFCERKGFNIINL
jgi:hypothetical protein